MNIAELVKNAIEEFGDRAHERFERDSYEFDGGLIESMGDYPKWGTRPFSDNDQLLFLVDCLINHDAEHLEIRLKPLPELFTHGCDVYGFEQEVKMWEWQDDNNVWNDFSPELCDYDEIIYGMTEYVHRRKTSAAREFCPEDANSRDGIEFIHRSMLGDRND